MSIYIGWNGGTYSSSAYSQQELRDRWEVGYVDLVFRRLIGVNLMPYVGTILEVFGPPRSVGLHFRFADGKRSEFIRRIDPNPEPPKKMSLAMRPKEPTSPLVPDDPGPSDPSGKWRKIAAANGIGASFRQADTGTSLHVAFDRDSCDVHVDRHGFVVRDEDGRVSWDANGLLRHLTVDLLGDKAPWALASIGVLNKNNRPVFQATLAPWLAVDLPSRENNGQLGFTLGLLLSGQWDWPGE